MSTTAPTKTFPTDEAWSFFMSHHHEIRECCQRFLPVPEMQIPNTRVAVVQPDGTEVETDRRAALPLQIRHTIEAFDAAVLSKDAVTLFGIMSDAWLRAPEDRRVYSIPGFTPMCDLLDFTAEGFVDPDPPDSDPPEIAP